MSIQSYLESASDFTQRIKQSFCLEEDTQNLISNRKKVIAWLVDQIQNVKQKIQELTNVSGFQGLLVKAGIGSTNSQVKKWEQIQKYLNRLKENVKSEVMEFDQFSLQKVVMPFQIRGAIQKLDGQKFPKCFGVACCPLMKNFFIKTKQGYERCIKNININNLKCTNLGSDSAYTIKYQRLMIEQLFNRLFNNTSELSTVLKIEIEKQNSDKYIQIFCYIEDQKNVIKTYQPLSVLKMDDKTFNLCFQQNKNQVFIDEISMLISFLTQLIIVPIQTVVSDYVLVKQPNQTTARVVKMHPNNQLLDLSFFMREHPSLRNPLFHFLSFIRNYQFDISALKIIFQPKDINSKFYQILNIIAKLVKNDFSFRYQDQRSTSLCLDDYILGIIWAIYQQILILANWLEEIVNPIKSTITIAQIKSKLYPIFNQISKQRDISYEEYKTFILNIPIENYLTANASKINIEKYKDRYVNINSVRKCSLKTKTEIYQNIFAKTMNNYDLTNTSIYESLYFLNFISKNNWAIYGENSNAVVHPSWRDKRIWKQIVQLRNSQSDELKFIGISLDALALKLGFDSIQFSKRPFESFKNQYDDEELLLVVKIIFNILRGNQQSNIYEMKSGKYLSYLLEKSFKYKKYGVAQFLIKSGVFIKNYDEIFNHADSASTFVSRLARIDQKTKLIELMRLHFASMYRRYKWQELLHEQLRTDEFQGESTALLTTRKQKSYIQKQLYEKLITQDLLGNNISRKDYMFCNNRNIAKIAIQNVDVYIEKTEYPLIKYFYYFFLHALSIESLVLNFCGFFQEKGTLYHLIECIPECFNFQKGLQNHTQSQLKNYINEDDISEAIILSIILMPTNIHLKNIIISLNNLKKSNNGDIGSSIFIVDFHDFYQNNCFQLDGGRPVLKVKNSLFLFQEMSNSISLKLMKKYSELNVLEIINTVFKKSSSFICECNKLRPKNTSKDDQLYSIIFQKGYATKLAERMFKVKLLFDKKLRNKNTIDHLQLLEEIDPLMRFYYEEVMRSQNGLIEREKILYDDSYKKSFIISNKLIDFIASGSQIETDNQRFPHHYMRFSFEGPSENLKHMHEQAIKFKVYTEKIKNPKQFTHKTIEYFIRNIDLSQYSKQERQQFFTKIQEYSLEYLKETKHSYPLSVLRLNCIEGIKDKKFKFSDERLKDMIFDSVDCTDSHFNSLIRKYQNMHNLYLKKVSSLEQIGELFISKINMLQIKNLKRLTITSCPDLKIIDIKCDQLENVMLRNNVNLTNIYINSPILQNMDCSQCSKLRLQNIGIYIFMKRNVLLCNNSCDGDVKKLQDPNYSIFLTRILRYLCNRFEESNFYKLDLVITLNKLQLIDQKFYRFGNAKIQGGNFTSNLLSFVTKVGTQTLRITLQQIFAILMKNEFVETLSIDQMLKIEIQSLRTLVNYGKQSKSKKVFKQVIFKQPLTNSAIFDELLSLVVFLFESVHAESLLTLKLSINEKIETEYYINLISILNNKPNLEKMQLIIEDSQIDQQFFEFLFNLKGDSKNKIYKLIFIGCHIMVNDKVCIEVQPFVKEVQLKKCKFVNIKFIEKFINLSTLQLNSCQILNLIGSIFQSIGTLKSLKQLSLMNMKQHLFEKNLQLQQFFRAATNLQLLQSLNFSGNKLDKEELAFFSQNISKLKIYQLFLYNFYDPSINCCFKNFLFHEHLKIVYIQFIIGEHTNILESFFDQLSFNNSIIKLKVKTDCEIKSTFFQKLQANKRLEQVNSNLPIPTWFKNYISANLQKNVSPFESELIEPPSGMNYLRQDFYRIGLSLDGGGVRGLLQATELDYLTRHVGQPLHKIFDCIGGTSIGGILSLASVGTLDGIHPICSTKDLMDIFQIYGNKIFKKTQMMALTNIFDTKYDVTSFEQLLLSKFKDCKLSDTLRETNVVITAVNRFSNENVIFRSINSIFDRNKDFYMRDIARATSAAPTFFPSAEIKNINATEKFSLIDGGIGLNNPSKLVIDDVIKIAQNESNKNNYFLLSLGTGRPKNEAIPQNAGIANIEPVIDGFTVAANYFIQKDLSQNYRGHYFRVSPSINLNRKDAELDNIRPQILNIYKQTGLQEAEQQFSNKITFGKFKDKSLIDWLKENTARKYDI